MIVELSSMSMSSYYSLPNDERLTIDKFIHNIQGMNEFASDAFYRYTVLKEHRIYRLNKNLVVIAKVVNDQTDFEQKLRIVQIQYGAFL